jgi:hypothetical protein
MVLHGGAQLSADPLGSAGKSFLDLNERSDFDRVE